MLKKLFKILCFIFTISFLFTCNSAPTSHSRSDNYELVKLTKTTSIKKVRGWSLNRYGKWENEKNSIPFATNSRYYAVGAELSFKDFLVHEAFYNGEKYVIFELVKRKGYYTYEYIKQDWNDYTARHFYITKADDYIINLKVSGKTVNTFKCLFTSSLYGRSNNKDAIKSITSEIINSYNNSLSFPHTFNIFTLYDTKDNVVRFFITTRGRENLAEIPDDNYFECPVKNFVSVFNPKIIDSD
jgi:hypothetical protein